MDFEPIQLENGIVLNRLMPEPAKLAENEKYSFSALEARAVDRAEKILAYPPTYRKDYDQRHEGSCVGASLSILMALYNLKPTPNRYDFKWLYAYAQDTDGNIHTDKRKPWTGTFIWAGLAALKNKGHVLYKYANLSYKKRTALADPAHGIQSYYWIKTVDEIRTAVQLYNRPVELGIIVYEGMIKAKQNSSGDWFVNCGGAPLGLHAICCAGVSDDRQAVLLLNSWGTKWPELTWLSYPDLEKSIARANYGEAVIAVDRQNTFVPR